MSEVRAYYDANAEYEWQRLERHPMEFALSMRMLNEYLPAPPASVLDVGGGPGRYSISLARLGYAVTLLDLSADCLAVARNRAAEVGVTLAAAVHGNGMDLGAFGDRTFDAVLVMGPMYHLLTPAERSRALQEAHRVLRPGGTLAVSFINRYARVRIAAAPWLLANRTQVEAELKSGLRKDLDGGFIDAYCAHPAEVAPLLEQHGFVFRGMIAAEGVRCELDRPDLSPADWAAWVDLQYHVARDPSVHGAAVHLLAVAQKA